LIKYLYLVQSDANELVVSYSVHINKLFSNFQSKQLVVKTISYEEAAHRKWDNADDGLLVIHSFKAWSSEKWNAFLDKVSIPLFVIPTEFNSDKSVMKQTFENNKVSKIIVCSEYFQKYFLKILEIDSNKVKLIYLSAEDFRPPQTIHKVPSKESAQPIILSPSMMTADKDYEVLLKAAKRLKLKYRNMIFALYLKSHPGLLEKERASLLADIHAKSQMMGLGGNIRILLDTQHPYKDYLKVADVVVIPIKESNDMYSGTLIDAIVANKAIVAPDTKLAYDLCKKEAGIYLYPTFKEVEIKPEEEGQKKTKKTIRMTKDEIVECIVDNCSIILDSPAIKDIMQEQNSLLAENYLFSKISQQYLNLVRRFKSQ